LLPSRARIKCRSTITRSQFIVITINYRFVIIITACAAYYLSTHYLVTWCRNAFARDSTSSRYTFPDIARRFRLCSHIYNIECVISRFYFLSRCLGHRVQPLLRCTRHAISRFRLSILIGAPSRSICILFRSSWKHPVQNEQSDDDSAVFSLYPFGRLDQKYGSVLVATYLAGRSFRFLFSEDFPCEINFRLSASDTVTSIR